MVSHSPGVTFSCDLPSSVIPRSRDVTSAVVPHSRDVTRAEVLSFFFLKKRLLYVDNA